MDDPTWGYLLDPQDEELDEVEERKESEDAIDFCADCGSEWVDHLKDLEGGMVCPDGGRPWSIYVDRPGE